MVDVKVKVQVPARSAIHSSHNTPTKPSPNNPVALGNVNQRTSERIGPGPCTSCHSSFVRIHDHRVRGSLCLRGQVCIRIRMLAPMGCRQPPSCSRYLVISIVLPPDCTGIAQTGHEPIKHILIQLRRDTKQDGQVVSCYYRYAAALPTLQLLLLHYSYAAATYTTAFTGTFRVETDHCCPTLMVLQLASLVVQCAWHGAALVPPPTACLTMTR